MTITRCRRKTRRYEIPEGTPALVEFELDAREGQAVARLSDISSTGVQFRLALEPAELEPGQRLANARIRLAGRSIPGELVVMHLSPAGPGQFACGAMFYPDEDRGRDKLSELLAQLVGDTAG